MRAYYNGNEKRAAIIYDLRQRGLTWGQIGLKLKMERTNACHCYHRYLQYIGAQNGQSKEAQKEETV